MKHITPFIIILSIWMNVSYAQTWTSYTSQNSGLPTNHVEKICIDGFGHLWFATDEGLARFDGTIWKTYRQGTEKQTLASNIINDLFYEFIATGEHEIWIATDDGISVMGINEDMDVVTFATPYRKENDNVLLLSNTVKAVAVDDHHTRWFGTDAGYSNFIDSQWKSFIAYDYFEINNDMVTAACTHKDTTYFATQGGGVTRFKYYLDEVTTASAFDRWGFIISDSVYSVFVDSKGTKWCGTNHGVSNLFGKDQRIMGNWISYTTDKVYTSVLKNGIPYDSIYAIEGGGLADNLVLAICEDQDHTMWFGTPKGLTSFNGNGWETFTTDDGLVGNYINDIKIDNEGTLWIATNAGVSKRSFISDVSTTIEAPDDYEFPLIHNFPNPFNTSTKIEFKLSTPAFTTVKIYNQNGQYVRTLIEQNLSAGLNFCSWNGLNDGGVIVPSGIYIVQIHSNNLMAFHKILLIK